MHDTFHVFGIAFPAYFTLLMGGYTVVILLAHRDCPRSGIDGNDLLDLALVLITAGIIGARLLHVVADEQFEDYVHLCTDPLLVKGDLLPGGKKCQEDAQCEAAKKGERCHPQAGTCHPGRDCLRALKFWYGGLAYYGGLGLAIPVGIWFVRRRKMPLWRVGDQAGWGIPLGLFFGRLGCLLAGCCFGSVSPPEWGLAFPARSPAWDKHVADGLIPRWYSEALPTWPAQVWEGIGCGLIFLWLYGWLRPRRKFDGQLFFLYCMTYAVLRFVVEFWRDDARGGFGGLSTSQWLGFPLFAFGAFMYGRHARKARRAAAEAAPSA